MVSGDGLKLTETARCRVAASETSSADRDANVPP
jgi:hypothetical protein